MIIDRAAPEEAEALAVAHVASWHETYPGLMPPSVLAERTVAGMTPLWRATLERGEPVFVLRDGAAILGLAAAGPQRNASLGFEADVRAIYVLRRAQGQGFGRALMTAMADDLLVRGMRSASLEVLRGNLTAIRFYERLGGRVVGRETKIVIDGTIVHITYGWDDVSAWRPPRQGVPRAGGTGG